ncbi:alpha/beta fold hydrolase [Peptoniphilaceae bacterium SGI.137]
MKKSTYHFPSATGVCEIESNFYCPEDEDFDTILVLHHGMAEHSGRYQDFIETLCTNRFAVYMHDMANHGKSNQNYEETGWFGEKDGWKGLISDFRHNVQKAVTENPKKKIVIMGHSMGSFICRVYTAWYPQDGFSAAIYMGTGGPNPIAGLGQAVSAMVSKVNGSKHKSKLLDSLIFGNYNKKEAKRSNFDWLTRDTKVVDQYLRDPYCGFLFTAQGIHDLILLNREANSTKWFESVPKDLPILLMSGSMDPVGDYSKGIRVIYEKLLSTEHSKVTMKLYPESRHELLNEYTRQEVISDIINWNDTDAP